MPPVAGQSPDILLGAARPTGAPPAEQYPTLVCSVFMLNMVLGTGPMTLPYAFEQAGAVLSLVLVLVFMALSYITTTFITESLALANALKHGKMLRSGHSSRSDARELHEVEIVERLELGAIAEQVLPKPLMFLVYFSLIAYAYGVLIVYCISANDSVAKELPALKLGSGEVQPYYYCLAIFACVVSPMCLVNFSRTRPLQLVVGFLRISVILLMITAMARFLYYDEEEFTGKPDTRKLSELPLWRIDGLPGLFGNAAFTFMVHHSMPGLVYPLKSHPRAPYATLVAFGAALILYLVLGFLAMWSFGDESQAECQNFASRPCRIQDLFNKNFSSDDWGWAATFIVCYPVLIVSVFPLVAITLRNNLRAFFVRCGATSPPPPQGEPDWRNYIFTLLTVCPPFLVASITQDVQSVLKYIGGYAGLVLMFLVPTLLLYYSRQLVGADAAQCSCRTPFGSRLGLGTVLTVFCVCVVFNTYKLVAG